jgi:stage II sporulation SpoE-like protein
MAIRDPVKHENVWKITPRRTSVIFLLAVFFIFATIGIANDVSDMGRTPARRFAISVVVIGLFAVGYATAGITLRRKFWYAFFPILLVQISCMAFLANVFPDAARLAQLDAAHTQRLQGRLIFDGVSVIFTVILSYLGFLYVSISEARRHTRSQVEKAALEGEMFAAREVQRVMVPEVLPPISGYAIESVYRPAAEVGGDFFQVIPLPSGRTLVVIGDVSGKGLRAAMIVSMIVGMLRTVSSFTEEPAAILAELNRRLFGRTHGGFATCLVVRVGEQGRLTVANAGHPPPYLNGSETAFKGSMPLGMVEDAAYEQTSLEMRVGDEAVLVTDGVAEAQNEKHVLLGFPRVESLLREGATAKHVAEVAQQHGQADDLTVISIARAG